MFNSVAEIYEAIDETRRHIYSRITGLTGEQAGFRPAADAWSVADLAEHLCITERRVMGLLKRLIEETESSGSGVAASGFKPFSLEEYIEQAKGKKFSAPEAAQPHEGLGISESIVRLRGTREELRSLQARIESLDLSEAKLPHPAFGPLNAYHWLAFVGLHEGRHLAQMECVIASQGFPAG